MPIQEIVKLQTITDEETRLSLLLAIHCAPILLGIKASNLVTVTAQECSHIVELFHKTNISHCFLETKVDKGILYLYREREIVEYLCSEEIQSFLRECGYEITVFPKMLETLSKRLLSYSNGEVDFPHEIGIFLEYPLIDVKGFLEYNGENYIYSGYWKVYGDVHNTIRRFQEYDLVRDFAIRSVLSGKKIQDITL